MPCSPLYNNSIMELVPRTDLQREWKGPVVPTAWKMLAEMRVQAPDATYKSLAASLGYNAITISRWVQDPLYQAYENFVIGKVSDELPVHLREERTASLERVQKKFIEHAEEMQDRLIELARTVDDPKVQVAIAQDFLDRAGAGAVKSQQAGALQVNLTVEHMEMFLTRLAESFGEGPQLVHR